MPKDIYGFESRTAEGWVMDGVVVNLENAGDIVITQVTVNYPRSISKFAPLNQSKRIMIAGEGNGVLSLGTVIGPTSAVKDFIKLYADPCRVAENSPITLSPGKVTSCDQDEGDSTPLEFVCSGCLLQSLSLTIQKISQDSSLLQAGMSMAFNTLQIK